ncbi:MAG: Uncharacterised protein [Bacteroidetes bacterium MED-G17]|nr:MAG: Uncharacterised protein [Bacteroidetes bacterium MED-G17]
MHSNALFFERLANLLHDKLCGRFLQFSFSSSKSELFFIFDKEFSLKYQYYKGFSLFQQADFQKLPKKNRLNPFKVIESKKLTSISAHKMNRSFSFDFEDGLSLVFKCYKNNGNVLLYKNNKIVEIFRKKIDKDWHMARDVFVNKTFVPARSKDEFVHLYPFVPKNEWIWKDMKFPMSAEQVKVLYQKIQKRIMHIEQEKYSINMVLSEKEGQSDMLGISTSFARTFISQNEFQQKKNALLQAVKKELKRKRNYLKKIHAQIDLESKQTSYKEIGDILMANLHLDVDEATKKIKLLNFYTGDRIDIKLIKQLSLQKNAEKYYEKGKSQHKKLAFQEKAIVEAKRIIGRLSNEIGELEGVQDFKSLKPYLKEEEMNRKSDAFPFRKRYIDGYDIWIGKNAKNNDLLITKYSHRNDIWLHARGVQGSHVLIKNSSGKNIPKHVLEKAGSLAAFFSKSKNNNLCPVVYTHRKYVRKPKGAPQGLVTVDKEKVILVEPKNEAE